MVEDNFPIRLRLQQPALLLGGASLKTAEFRCSPQQVTSGGSEIPEQDIIRGRETNNRLSEGRKIYQWAHTHKGHSCHEKLTSGSSRPPRASAYLEFASRGGPSRAAAFSFPLRKLLSGAGLGRICVRSVVTLGSGLRLATRDSGPICVIVGGVSLGRGSRMQVQTPFCARSYPCLLPASYPGLAGMVHRLGGLLVLSTLRLLVDLLSSTPGITVVGFP